MFLCSYVLTSNTQYESVQIKQNLSSYSFFLGLISLFFLFFHRSLQAMVASNYAQATVTAHYLPQFFSTSMFYPLFCFNSSSHCLLSLPLMLLPSIFSPSAVCNFLFCYSIPFPLPLQLPFHLPLLSSLFRSKKMKHL